jgi:hypothetical protein
VDPAVLLVEGALGVWFITGVRLRPAAILLALTGPPALLVTGPVGLLSAMDLLGVAVFLAFVPPSDATFGRVEPSPEALRRGLLALLFGQTELPGHLPVYGVFRTLLAYGSHPRTAELVRWLPRPRRATRRRPALAG